MDKLVLFNHYTMKETVKSLSEKLEKTLERIDTLYEHLLPIFEVPEGASPIKPGVSLKIKKKEPDNGVFKPKEREEYWYIDDCGEPDKSEFCKIGCHDNVKMGNSYKTAEQTQAVIDLKIHIYKFPMPTKDDNYWLLGEEGWETIASFKFGRFLCDIPDYHSGTYLNKDMKTEDREERIRLLKLTYNL